MQEVTAPAAPGSPWRAALAGRYLPCGLVLQLPEDASGLPDVLAKPAGAHPQAWVCRGPQCLPLVADLESLVAALSRHDSEI